MPAKSKKVVRALESGIVVPLSRMPQNGVLPLDNYASFRLLDQGLLSDAKKMLGLDSSSVGRNQLQFLSWALIGEDANPIAGPHTFFHTRFDHSLRAAAICQFTGTGKMSERDLVILALAALLHDIFLLPGGDSWKSHKQQKTIKDQLSWIDEDDSFGKKMGRFNKREWIRLCQMYGLRPGTILAEVEAIVLGRGLRGQIQEVADTASYMLGDISAIAEVVARYQLRDFAEIFNFANQNPWDIWQCTYKVGEDLVILKPDVLYNFLRLRALLWGQLYNSPAHKFLELVMRKIVYPYLLKEKLIDVKGLFKEGDSYLWNIVESAMGWPTDAVFNLDLLGGWPRRREFDTLAEALAFEQDLRQKGHFTLLALPTLSEDSAGDFQKAKSKTNKYNVLDGQGKAAPYNLVFPHQSAEIEEMFVEKVNPRRFQVYWVENPKLTSAFKVAWNRAVQRWVSNK